MRLRVLAGIGRLILLALLVALMGPGGRAALGEMTGLDVLGGVYEYRADSTVIRAIGRSQGVTWRVWGLWRHGAPVALVLHGPQWDI